jgi:hypothetical protein
MNTFEAGQELSTRSIGDHNCIFTGTVIKRTAKTVTVNTRMDGERRCKIHTNDEGEFIYPHGQYSMSPIFRA